MTTQDNSTLTQLKRGQQINVCFIWHNTPFSVLVSYTGTIELVGELEHGVFERVNDPLVASGELEHPRQYRFSKERLLSMMPEQVEADVWTL